MVSFPTLLLLLEGIRTVFGGVTVHDPIVPSVSRPGPPEGSETDDLCPPNPTNGQLLWRYRSQAVDVVLTPANVLCMDDSCSTLNSSSTRDANGSPPILHLTIQLGDWLQFWIDVTTNSSRSHTAIIRLPLRQAHICHPDGITSDSIVKEVDTANFTLSEDILKPGFHLFQVRTGSEEGCETDWQLNITVRGHDCTKGREVTLCSQKGICTCNTSQMSFACDCCPGYIGKYCEERDGCYGNPCKHGGFCVDIAEGLTGATYQCLCPHGYRGRSCEEQVNLCDRKPCQNNGTCHGNQTDYWCECPPGFTGLDCETNVNECISNPCVHGVCEDGLGSYKCYCLPGYGGDHCEFEYDECDSSPCINAGACEDLVAGYRCHCGPGYRGRRCQVKIDLCQPNPCPSPSQCVDRGNNYSCVCHPGYNGLGCTQHYDPCYPNPCQNGGSCWPSLDSFFCSCRPGYTGDICEEPMYPPKPLPRTLDDPSVEGATIGPADASLDHLHNVYIAAATLAGACLIVVSVVTICHCRIHKTYQRFTRKLSRSCSEIKQQKLPRQVLNELPWERF